MEAIILPKEEYQQIQKQLSEIKNALNKNQNPHDTFIDNAEFLKRMSISKRTAQTWRDEGIISFSQIGSKIYYKMSDVDKMLDKNPETRPDALTLLSIDYIFNEVLKIQKKVAEVDREMGSQL